MIQNVRNKSYSYCWILDLLFVYPNTVSQYGSSLSYIIFFTCKACHTKKNKMNKENKQLHRAIENYFISFLSSIKGN